MPPKEQTSKRQRLAFMDQAELAVDTSAPPSEFCVLKYGTQCYTKTGKPGTFEFSEQDADTLIAEFEKRKRDLVVDYEHQSLSGKEAPAAGWVDRLEKTAGGLVVKVKDWTDKAKAYLQSKEYRYFSPVVDFSRSGRPAGLHSIALTNHPALHGIPALVADDLAGGELDDDTEPTNQNEDIMEALKPIASALGIELGESTDPGACSSAILTAIGKLRDEQKSMVAMSDYTAVKTELAKVKAAGLVAKAKSDKKLAPELESWALNLAETNVQAFSDWCQYAPVLVKAEPLPMGNLAELATPAASRLAMSDTDAKALDEKKQFWKQAGCTDEQIDRMLKEGK